MARMSEKKKKKYANTPKWAKAGNKKARHDARVEQVLRTFKPKALVVGITSDILFTLADARQLADNIPDARLETISSDFGHDGFLVEHAQLNTIICNFLKQ